MIAGLQKMTLLDFPGKVACTVFLQGCNWRCPFCHNSELLPGKGEELMSVEKFLQFLKTRQGLLEGVCISGGEPTLYKELPALLAQIKALGFSVKLDTNGSRPEVLKALVAQKLVDYVAVDAKNSPARYAETVGKENFDLAPVEESMRFLIDGDLPYELRTTLVRPLHDETSVVEMGKWLASLVPGKKPEKLFLQRFTDRDTVAFAGFTAPEEGVVDVWRQMLAPYAHTVTVRN